MTSRPARPGRYHATLLALEPRMMFDAAAVMTAQDTVASVAAAGDTHDGGDRHAPAATHALDMPGERTPIEGRPIEGLMAERTGTAPTPREIVFIDTSVADYRQLAAEWAGRGEVVLVDGTADGLDQVRAALAGRSDLSAIHIVGHGASGVLWLGTTRIDAAAIGGDLSASLGAVGRSLGQDGDILIYGCDFAAGAAGADALAAFAHATGADVAASTDTTGYAGRGGDWVLEAERGTIESRALASGDWVHTLDPNVPMPISVAVGSLTVRDANGTVVFSSANNYNNNAATSPNVGVGAIATWANAATFNGRSVDLKATVVSLTSGDAVQFERVTGTGSGPDDPSFLLRDLTTGNTPATVQVRWTLVDSTTGDPLPANVRFTIGDIDGIGGNPNTRESVTASTQNLAYFTRERVTDINFTSSLDAITASGTQDENTVANAPLTPQSAATFDWTDVSAFTLTYTLTPNATQQARFYHDGDADFVYTDPVYVSVPRLDLDRDNSTAAGNDAHFTFTEGGPSAPIVDADLVVTNPMGPTAIVGATVTLTDYKAADAFTVGALPSNISANIGQPTNGRLTVTLTGNGSEADYTAALKAIGFRNGSDTPDPTQRVIEVAFSNDTLTSAVATSRIDVVPVNDAPIAANDTLTTPEDTRATIVVLGNDRDPDGDALTVTAASALHGTVVRNADGTLTYTPAANYNGADTISYTIADGNGGTASAGVAVTVTPVNDAPQPARIPSGYFVVDGTAVNVSVADIFGDVDGDTLTYAATGLPAGITIDPATGLITGTVDRSASQVNNGRYPVVITATDPSGAQATQRVAVTALNPAPVAGDDRAATAEDTPVTIAVLANDSDPDRDPLTVTAATAQNGIVVRNPDGTLAYTPNANYNGIDTIRYTISDGQGGTDQAIVTVDVAPQRDTPANRLPPAQTVAEDAALVFSGANGNAISVANVDGGDLTVTLAASHGRVTLSRTTGLAFAAGDGSDDAAMTVTGSVAAINAALEGARFVGDADYHGPAGLRVTSTRAPVEGEDFQNGGAERPLVANDRFNYVDQAAVPGWSTTSSDGLMEVWRSGYEGVFAREGDQFFEINSEDNSSIFQQFRSVAGSAVSVDFSHRGRAGDDTMRLTATDLGADGVFGTPDDTLLFSRDYTDGNADWRDYTAVITGAATGNVIDIEFAAISEASGDPRIGNFLDAVAVTQAGVPLSASDTLAITVTPVADIVADSATTAEDTGVVIDALANDNFADPARAIVAIDGRAIVAGGGAVTVADGTVTLGTDGRLTFAPTRDYDGTTRFTYTVAAGGSTETATETVVVTPVNDAPIATGTLADRAALDGASVAWATAAGFADVEGDALGYTASGLPVGLAIDPRTGVISGTIDRSASQPNGGRYTVTVTARDGGATAATQSFRIDVANPAPVAVDDAAITHSDTATIVAVLANDADSDGDPLTVSGAVAARGQVVILGDNSLRYVPPAGLVGRDTVSYTISDGQGGTATAQLTIDVYNDPPTTDPAGAVIVRDGQAIDLPIGAGFRDPDGDPLRFAATGLPPGLSIDPVTGRITGIVASSASRTGPYAATVTADDGHGGTSSVSFDWIVTNPAPIAADDAARLAEDAPTILAPLVNDSDPDGDPLTIVAASAGHGQVAINPDGTLTYTPDRDYAGPDTIAYTIEDADRGRASTSITLTIDPVNDAPAAGTLPARSSPDGAAVSVPVAPAFVDIDGDTLAFTASGLPAGLSIDAATGVIAGTIGNGSAYGGPAGDGVFPVTVAATDPSGRSAQTTFAWTVAQTSPVAADDRATTAEDNAVVIPVLANDSDPDGDPLTLLNAAATHGQVAIRDGALLFTPAPDFVGEATITYTVVDPAGNRSTASVAIAVTAVNDVPDARPIPAMNGRDAQAINLSVGGFFADRDGDSLRFSATGLPVGLAIDPATGVIAGAIDRAASAIGGGVYHVIVAATDPAGARTESAFDWTIVNPAPTAVNDTATVVEDTPTTIAVLGNDTDPDGDPLTVVAARAQHGRVAINADGTLAYTPDRDFAGTDVIVYRIVDGNGGRASASVLVTVMPVQDAPVAAADRTTTAEDTAVTIPVLANDIDVDGDRLTVIAADAPRGTVTIGADNSLTYTPAADFNGEEVITYTVADGRGGSSTSTVTVTVTPVNDAPAVPDRTATTAEDRAVFIPVLDTARDADGDPLTLVAAVADRGTVAIASDGTLLYTPPADFVGTDTIRYRVADGRGGITDAQLTVTVSPVNDAPTAAVPAGFAPSAADAAPVAIDTAPWFADVDGEPVAYSATGLPVGLAIDPVTGAIRGTLDRAASQVAGGVYPIAVSARDAAGASVGATFTLTITNPAPTARDDAVTLAEDTPTRLAVLANDIDPDGDPLTIVEARAVGGSVTINADGTLSYTPVRDFAGVDTVTYTVDDGNGGRATATVQITVTPVQDAPEAAPDRVTTVEDTPVTIPVLANDSDADGDPLTVVAAGAPRGVVTIGADNRLIYTPAADFTGEEVITYTIADGRGGSSSSTVTVTVTPVNDAPIVADRAASTAEDRAVVIPVLDTVRDPEGDPLTVVAAIAERGTVAIGSDGTLLYTPPADFVGSDTIRYRVADGQGGITDARLTVTVSPVNDAPTAMPPAGFAPAAADAAPVAIDTAPWFADVDGEPLVYRATGLPAGLTIDPTTGAIRGTLGRAASQVAGGIYPITVTASDAAGASAAATFTLTVANPAPIAGDDAVTVVEDTPTRIAVLLNDIDPDGDPLAIVDARATSGSVTINVDGTLLYTPRADFAGTDTIVYTVADADGGLATAIVQVTVTPVEDAPVAAPDRATTAEDMPVVIPVLANDRDADGDPLTVVAAVAGRGTVAIGSDGRLTYRPDRDFTGEDAITYTIADSRGGTATSTITVVVTPVNDAPIARDDLARTAEDIGIVIPVLANDSDADGDPLTVIAATAARGSVTVNRDGSVTYVPAADFAGADTIRYTIADGQGGTASAVVAITVDPVNDVPVVPAGAPIDAVGGRPILIDPLAGARDVDGDPLTVTRASAANGTAVVRSDGSLAFTPALGFVGTTTIAAVVADGRGGETVALIVVRVADGRGADIEQLLRIGRVTFLDPPASLAIVPLADGVARNPLSLLSAVEGIRSLNATGIGDRPVLDAVDALRSLRGTTIDADGPIAGEVARLDALRDQRDAGDRLFDHRWGDFLVKGFSGFSVAADREACVMIESVVRGGAIYLEVRDIAEDGARAPIRSVDLRLPGGGRVPDWIRVDPRGLAIIERAADADEIHLLVRVNRADGRTSTTPIVVQGATGMVELDRHHPNGHRAAQPLDATLDADAGHADAATLDRFFQ